MQKESLVSIRVRTAAPAWLCIFHYVKLRVYKHLLKIKLWGFCTSLVSLMSILSLSISGWSLGTQRLSAFTFLPGLQRPMWERAQGRPPAFTWIAEGASLWAPSCVGPRSLGREVNTEDHCIPRDQPEKEVNWERNFNTGRPSFSKTCSFIFKRTLHTLSFT